MFRAEFPNIPEELPETGLIIKNADGQKLGIWIMPDNRSHGMLETFLLFLAPNETDALVTLATDVCRQAKHLGAPYKEVHQMKAHIYSWLAWQDEPGRQLHQAVKEHILKASSPYALPFVGWFRNLFEV